MIENEIHHNSCTDHINRTGLSTSALPVKVELMKMRMVLEFTGQFSSINPRNTRSTLSKKSDLSKRKQK